MIAPARAAVAVPAARVTAAPRVGPEHGLHTAPRSAPRPNWPASPFGEMRSSARLKYAVRGALALAKRSPRKANSISAPNSVMRAAAVARIASPEMPNAEPAPKTSSPIPAKVALIPAASASGPKRCWSSAARTTKGRTGRTQGLRVVSAPAAPPRISSPNSERLVEQRADSTLVGLADRARHLVPAAEHHQRALRLRLEALHHVLLRVVIDAKPLDPRVLRLARELVEHRLLRLAGRAPVGVDLYKNRLACLLRRFERGVVERALHAGKGWEGRKEEGEDERAKGKAYGVHATTPFENIMILRSGGVPNDPERPLPPRGTAAPGASRPTV